jgi:lysophospholipid acyltransferase (LPLAT)-like uncharacterized protein
VSQPKKFSQRAALYIVPRITSLILRVIGCTLRFEHLSEPDTEPGHLAGGPGVFCFWHSSLLPAAYFFRNLGIGILISRSFDGELIARTVERLGFATIRGSNSRDAATGLMGMASAWREGRIVAFTSDGPRGPRFVCKPGVAAVAALTGDTVGAFYILPQRAWILRSWDRMAIPQPFSRVVITWAKHVVVTDAERDLLQVQAALDRCVAMAEQYWMPESPKAKG